MNMDNAENTNEFKFECLSEEEQSFIKNCNVLKKGEKIPDELSFIYELSERVEVPEIIETIRPFTYENRKLLNKAGKGICIYCGSSYDVHDLDEGCWCWDQNDDTACCPECYIDLIAPIKVEGQYELTENDIKEVDKYFQIKNGLLDIYHNYLDIYDSHFEDEKFELLEKYLDEIFSDSEE